MYDYQYPKKINHTDKMLSKEDITLAQTFLHCMFEITVWVNNMHTKNNCLFEYIWT